ncbi:MAG: FAD-dependent oxidoreductase [Rhodospirillaceae bacterium]|nr:FAD-dependent oxidoreductase [Rhodospirillaceae bacterium]
MTETLQLANGFAFQDLYARNGLVRLDGRFCAHLKDADAGLFNRLMSARAEPDKLEAKDESQLVIDLAPHLDDFIASLFGIQSEARALASRHDALAPLYEVKRLFVQRRAVKEIKPEDAAALDGAALTRNLEALIGGTLTEESYASAVVQWLADAEKNADALEVAKKYAAWAVYSDAGKAKHGRGVLFRVPRKPDPMHLVPAETIAIDGVEMLRLDPHHWRRRDGFALTDAGMDLKGALDHANYCIWCHNQGKDSCSKGLRDRKTGEFQKSTFGVTLAGCPLEEKISEMNLVKSRGISIGALAVVAIDNPLCAATGHRICNDCMKACIYQKQEPVDIPQVETRTLKDVLSLPWGFEIYGLLTRWNPLNVRRPLPKPETGYKVLVVGLGPAGFNLSHHLVNDGHAVAAIDGLKIEPLPAEISGVEPLGRRVPFKPIRDISILTERLDQRAMAGFGGVAEYGITVRWDKNFLKIVRLLLERRTEFAMYGGVRFGGTLTVDGAFKLGFDHIALCMGAGRPTIVPMKNGLARGVRAASDFLMGLQLTGAAKADSLANLQIRLPVVVIGGGLTAIDTATEARAYYPIQVEKFSRRYEALVADEGEAKVRAGWTDEEREVAEEFLAHAKALADPGADKDKLIDSWGGVTIAYRRRMIDAPSYTLNHEEVEKALEEGIRFAENLSPVEVEVDLNEHARAVVFERDGTSVRLPARAVLMAAGTQPNTVLAREMEGRLELDGKYFRAVDEDGNPVTPERVSKPATPHVLAAIEADGRALSFFGDLHPTFAGNVVKAMGGTKQGYPVVSRALAKRAPTQVSPKEMFAALDDGLRARVHAIRRLTPNIVEIVIKAPFAAEAFHPGQFYRLQNYESKARRADSTLLTMEGLAVTGASVDREDGLVSTIVLEMGGSSDLCAELQAGEPVILMGPTGMPTETPAGETAILIGGGLGNAVLFSIGAALRAQGSKVLYFAGYKSAGDRYKVEEIEAAADVIVWSCDQAGLAPTRPQDLSFTGNIIEAMTAYARGELGAKPIDLKDADRLIVIGSDRMMAAVAHAREGVLKAYLKPSLVAIASINSPMQCMMKEICAQCLQTQVDPVTGKETVVFSCFNQDQPLGTVDFDMLRQRLSQNGAQEKLAALWIDKCLKEIGRRPVAA